MPATTSSRSSIDQRFQFIVVTIYVLMIPLVIWALANQWMAYAKARDALRDFETFRMSLDVVLDLSAERTAAFAALEDNAPTFRERQAKLAEARRTVDDDLAALRTRLETTACEPCEDLVAATDHAQSLLQEARRVINTSVGTPPADRSVDQINDAMDDLADVTPQMNSIAASLAPGIIQRDAYAVRYLYVAGFTALLRDNASLLGSQLSRALTAGRPLSSGENLRIERIMGKINQLYALVRSTTLKLPELPNDLLRPIADRYFGEGMGYIAQVRSDASHADAGLSATEFASHYVPLMEPIVALRDNALHVAGQRLHDDLVRQRVLLAFILVGITGLTLLIAEMMRQFHKQVVRPLVEARRSVLAIASGDLSPKSSNPRYEGETQELFEAIHVLKENSQERLQLERERDRLVTELQLLADTDSLTGLLNRRAFEVRAERLLGDRWTSESYVVITTFDIDHFKRINDTYGHESGDRALKRLAELCRESWRADDIIGRIGGEEFAVITMASHADQAPTSALRLMRRLHEETIEATDGRVFSMTVSFGVTFAPKEAAAPLGALLRHADALLYRAKTSGRDRIETDPWS